ncbi:hypothetical protein N0V90_010962 [Kalmusia sp. IMI 367209]|nr:hypothetical protein N0V90_010962 [Kalmusia sp. IMI 367209]
MRAPKVAFFLLGLLVLYTVSAPVAESGGVAGFLEGPLEYIKGLLPGEHNGDGHVQARDLGAVGEQGLEKRRVRGSRARRKRPARKRPQRKKKTPTTKKNKKPKGKKGKTPKQNACKATKGKDGNLQARAGKTNSRQCKQKVKKTRNYKVAERAAKKKGYKLEMGQAYLLRFKSNPGPKNHQQLIVGTVKRRTNPADGSLDFVATSSELIKPLPQSIPTNWKARAKQRCRKLHGAKCKHRGIKEVYQCKETLKKWPKGQFLFEGGADPEFAVPDKFVEIGELGHWSRGSACNGGFYDTDGLIGKAILEKDTTYDVVYNNCRTHALKVKNVTKLKKGQNPLVDIELETLAIDDSG